MLSLFTIFLALMVTSAVARPNDTLISMLTARQTASPPPRDCNATCAVFTGVKKACKVPHCGCNETYFQAQGDCLVCQTDTPQDAASVQFFLDAEQDRCRIDGISINFRLDLPPDAQTIVDEFDRQSTILRQQQKAYLALQIAGGQVGLVIVLAFAIFSHKVHRDATFSNFCITWIFSSVVFSILLYRGTDGNTIANSLGRVPPNTCLAQAALANGAQVMTACSTMALVIQLWIRLRTAIHGDLLYGLKQKGWMTIVVLVSPYILFLAFALPAIFVANERIENQGTSLRRAFNANFYCTIIDASPFLRPVYGVTLGLLLIAAVFDAFIIAMLYRDWKAFRHIQAKGAVSLSILVRVMIFSIYRVLVAVTYGAVLDMPRLRQVLPPELIKPEYTGPGFAYLSDQGQNTGLFLTDVPVWVDMLQATIPLVAFLVLGVNANMLASLMFWRRNERAPPTL